MKIINTKAALLSVALIGLSVGTALPAAADSFSNPTLADVIRAQGDQASAAITRQVKADLMLRARILSMPGVMLGPTRLVETEEGSDNAWGETAETAAIETREQLDLWVHAMLSNSERDLYHALSLARIIIIDSSRTTGTW